ncbi:MAG: TetR/AcrR family transcriptional regulator [Anaerolineaceae bacterium]|nr:TetR/AcrR family transcriptional regulator [Anaerolineaceae bacterium]
MTLDTYHHGNLKEALISAGLEILSKKGIESLSLRNVAKQIGVSHTAPYNHFHDKQDLLAAISAAGHKQFHLVLLETYEQFKNNPTELIIEIAWAYLQFALQNPDKFKLMFSSALEEEQKHPEFEEITQKTINLFEEMIRFCQSGGALEEGNVYKIAINLWSSVHGFTMLVLEDQFPPNYLHDQNLKELLKAAIS